jgi:predicted RNA-binding Zn-ribbon protein involved in translation (DUF1610 family)
MNPESINKILQTRKVVSKHFSCPKCKEDNAYTFFDFDQKVHKWSCPTCGSGGWLRELNSNN